MCVLSATVAVATRKTFRFGLTLFTFIAHIYENIWLCVISTLQRIYGDLKVVFNYIKTYGGVKLGLLTFFCSVLDGGEWSGHTTIA
jgi:hypothetical protein